MKDGKEYGATNSGPFSLPRLSKQSCEVQQGSDQLTLQIQDLILFFASPSNHLRSNKAPIKRRHKFDLTQEHDKSPRIHKGHC